MKKKISVRLFIILLSLVGLVKGMNITVSAQNLIAFPGAEGFGAYSRGGRGGRTLHVSTLEDRGPGSLRWAVEQKGPRTIVFEVSGTIELKDRLDIENPYITIAGQTAPGDGICLRGETLNIAAHDVIVRYIRVRLGDAMHGIGSLQGKDAISISEGKDIIVDHCSGSWSLDEVLSSSTRNPTLTRVTVQWCFITEGLNPSKHGFGSLIRGTGGAKYSYLHNLYAHNKGRNPRPGNYDSNPHDKDPEGLLLDFRNNVIYNWGGGYAGYNSDSKSVTRLNYVGNYLIPGVNSEDNGIAYATGSRYNRSYFAGNYYNGELSKNQWDLVKFRDSWSKAEIRAYKSSQPFETGPVKQEDATTAFQHVLQEGGASLPKRDPVDHRMVKSVQQRTGKIIKSQEDVGGWPTLNSATAPEDTDRDGMPDGWEVKYGFDPNAAGDSSQDMDGDGYTNLEEYLNGSDPNTAAFDDSSQLPRLLVLTDIGDDPDDEQSLVRLLVYANAFEIEGFVTELWWKDTHKGRYGAMTPDSQMDLLHRTLDLYGQIRPNLDRHEKGYPQADALHKVVKRGKVNIKMTLSTPKGDPMQWIGSGQDTDGSNWIIDVVDRDDTRPVDICVWGGTADLAQALLRVREERSLTEVDAFISRIRVHAISDQDDTGPWIRKNFPNLFYILDHDPNGDKWESCYRGMFYGGDESLTTRAWIDEHVRHGHGPLGAFYPSETNTNKNPHGALKEGDTPSWFFFYLNGLNDPVHPDYGGWGGRYAYNGRFWQDAADTVDGHTSGRATVYRWRPSFQNDFAARMDWCVNEFDKANHAPVARIKGDLQRNVKSGETISLAATASDPDGNRLTYKWWQYVDASSVDTNVNVINDDSPAQASFVVPNEPGKQIHIILNVTDNGTPSLVGYQRIVFNIK